MYEPLNNYLKSYRRRRALSQEDVAFLLGGEAGTTVSRHETNERVPNLETAIAYHVIFGASVSDLFAGVTRSVDAVVKTRAEELIERIKGCDDTPRNRRKLEVLTDLISGVDIVRIPSWE